MLHKSRSTKSIATLVSASMIALSISPRSYAAAQSAGAPETPIEKLTCFSPDEIDKIQHALSVCAPAVAVVEAQALYVRPVEDEQRKERVAVWFVLGAGAGSLVSAAIFALVAVGMGRRGGE